jgi:hypothetical protein
LRDNEIDRCRFGDNSDRYAGNWHQRLHFFEEKTMKKVQKCSKSDWKTAKFPCFYPPIDRFWGRDAAEKH